ncbi:hypothetical protein HPB47_010044 [Ixodes persulcatus]|uniref:Uncharacterized protein n=1 Tax=Ixodes persulcatus TaxID=34615 RepID=A0AC60P095_IXOPE|nr:hypothetical protein HPB47_010044 [Ixodes persulcatus]
MKEHVYVDQKLLVFEEYLIFYAELVGTQMKVEIGVAPSVLLAKLADSDNTSSSDDDDEGRFYEAKFAELFDAPCTVPKVKAYVSIVRTYSDKARGTKNRKCSLRILFFLDSFSSRLWDNGRLVRVTCTCCTCAEKSRTAYLRL